MRLSVLVLGADGFIGRHLLNALAASDWALPIAGSRRPSAAGERIARLRLDATNEQALIGAVRNVDAIVNCVAGPAATIVRGAQALAAATNAQERPPRLVHISSMAVYGPTLGVVAESAPLISHEPYGQAKIAAETILGCCSSTVILRPGIVYGPGSRQWTDRVARWLLSRRLGDLGAAGDGLCNLVFIDDLVAALCQAVRLSAIDGQVFNLAMSDLPTWNQYFVAFARALGAVPVTRISGRRLKLETKLLAPPLKIAEMLSRGANVPLRALPEAIPPSLGRLFRQNIRLDGTRAEQRLGLQWTALAEGLRQSAQALGLP